jgi:hypothetical protein
MSDIPLGYTLDRQKILGLAHRLQDPGVYANLTRPQDDDALSQRIMLVTHAWGYYGAQSVVMPHTYAAALMATDAHNAIGGQQLPWPTFEIQVPPGLLLSSHGEVFNILVCEIPPWVTLAPMLRSVKYFVIYNDTCSTGQRCYDSLEALFGDEFTKGSGTYVTEPLNELFSEDHENRLWSMITRLVAGVVLAVTMARSEKPAVYAAGPKREKHGTLKANVHKLGQAVTIDCRQAIRDYVGGTRRNELTVSTLVRGHWRNQAYGERWSQHRLQWIQPFFKGAGPLTQRPTHLKQPEAKGEP